MGFGCHAFFVERNFQQVKDSLSMLLSHAITDIAARETAVNP